MSAPVNLGLARAIARHAAASRRADDAAKRLGPGDLDAAAEQELAAWDGLDAALADLSSTDDVAAVLAHAYDQGGREGEPGAQGAVLLKLVAALARRREAAPAPRPARAGRPDRRRTPWVDKLR